MMCIAIFKKGWYSSIFFLGFMATLISCESHRNPEMVKMASYIDSINVEFGKDLTYDSLKMAEINRLIEVSDSINYPEGIINLAVTASNIYMSYFKNEQALEMLIKSQQTMSRVDDKGLEALINFHFGKLNRMIKNFDIALDYFLNAVELSLIAKDSSLYSKSLTNIGNLHLEKGPLERAKDNFIKAIEIDQLTGNYENLIMNYHQMSVFYHRKGEMDSAQIYLDRVLQLSKESDNQLLFVYYLANSAAVNINNNEFGAENTPSPVVLHNKLL
jgi:tetratricopeptide (TPR) repeat protein